LYTRPRDAKDWPGGDWERPGEAKGEVAVPAGRQVRLELGAGSRTDLSPLRRLEHDDLRSLRVRDADIRGDALAPIAHLTGLEEIDLLNCPIGDEGTQFLAGMTRLRCLGISGCRVGDEGLARLAALAGLERLDLSNGWITEAGLAQVGRMKSLKSLSLYRCDIGDGGLAQLKRLTTLESLRLADCLHITDAGLAHLNGLSRLKSLDLESTPITDAGLAHLAGLKSLEDLNLPDTKITDRGLGHLRRLRSLRRLSLPLGMSDVGLAYVGEIKSLQFLTVRAGWVNDRGITSLSGLDRLQELNFGSGYSGAHVTDAAAAHLAKLPALKKLWLQNTEIGDYGLEAVASCRSLEWLCLNTNRVTSEGLRNLSSFPALTYLSLSGIRGSADGLRHLRSQKSLVHLNIDGRGWLDVDAVSKRGADEGLDHFSELSRLESLTLNTPLSDAGMRQLAGMTSLRWLQIDDKNNMLTDDGLACVAGMKKLTHLRVSGWITDGGLKHLEGLRALYFAGLGCRIGAISDEAAATLKARNPSIQVLDYTRAKKPNPPPPAIGQLAPEFEVAAFNGKKIRLGGLRGRVTLLYFWATWCSPCLADTPKLKAFIYECRAHVGLFEAISLSVDEDSHWAIRHAERNGLGWPQVWVGRDSPVCSAYAVNFAPHYVVIGADCKIAYAGNEFDGAKKAVNCALERSIPNDPLLGEQWYLLPAGDERANPGSINAIAAWRHIKPAKPIVVAVIDTGVNYRPRACSEHLDERARDTQRQG
jgi:Leucine-rich repeat (LRR) protein/thiol-disulfide isomerase/thioredoxin